LRIVGGLDPAWDGYQSDLFRHIAELDLEDHVEIRPHCPDAELVELYRCSHVYLCLSEHEGFNVPIIESQAIGLPTIGAAVAATGETAGPFQLFSTLPESPEDDYFYAALIQEICTDEALRHQLTLEAEHNVVKRFTDEPIENRFVAGVYRALGLK
jgi:glycosyltransferase involved in cell wall biosynthesis